MFIIEDYQFGYIKVSGKTYTRDLIVFPDKIITNWWRKEGHNLCMEDLADVLKFKPDILIVGTGYYGVMKVHRDVIEKLEKIGIEVKILKTSDAVRAYNELARQNKRVAAALHLTC